MSDPGPPAVRELLEWAHAADRSREAKRARVPLLLEPWLPWLSRLPVVKVAGTNGKGSVCAMLSASLRRDGRRCGLFTSPHLVRVTERFRVDDREVPPERLDRHAARVLARARALVRRRGEAFRPSFFEALLAAALDLFRDAQVDVVVCEAGVGGAHDATSLLPGELGAITTVALDHQDVLGDTLESIAADKAGILGPGAHLVLGPRVPAALGALVARHAPGVTLSQAGFEGLRAAFHGEQPTTVSVDLPGGPLELRLPLLGRHQLDNFASVLELARHLGTRGVLRDPRSLAGVEATRWPGRLELRPGRPRFVIDAAHNVEGLTALAYALDDLVPYADRVLVFGMGAAKDAAACAALLPRLAPALFLVEGFHSARPVSALRALVPGSVACLGAFGSPRELMAHVGRAAEGGGAAGTRALGDATVIVAGSIFMVGDVESALDDSRVATLPVVMPAGAAGRGDVGR